jgi:transcriptional regulator with XRE-family HTH domain
LPLLLKKGFRSQNAFAKAVGLDGPKLTNLLNGKRRPQLDEILKMSVVLKVTPVNLFRCFGMEHTWGSDSSLSVSAGIFDDDSVEFHDLLDNEPDNTIQLPVRGYTGMGIKVRTQTLGPRYYEGEILAAKIPREDRNLTDFKYLIGREVFACVADGGIFLKILQPGTRSGLYHLTSINVRIPPIIDAQIDWVQSIDFHIPGWFRPKYLS